MDRRACEELRIPSICLMENASRNAAEAAIQLGLEPAARVVCVAGPGNNGGDAMGVARHLAIAGFSVSVAILDSRSGRDPDGDAGVQLGVVRAMGLPLLRLGGSTGATALASELRGCALVVDGLFGTGLLRPLEGLAAACVEAINGCGARVLALDVPSGLDCDSGAPLGACIRATRTVTFVAPKIGFEAPGSAEWTGEVVVAGIGAPLVWPPGSGS